MVDLYSVGLSLLMFYIIISEYIILQRLKDMEKYFKSHRHDKRLKYDTIVTLNGDKDDQ